MLLLQDVTLTECYSYRMLLLQNITLTEYYSYRMLLLQNVTLTECYSYRMLLLQNVSIWLAFTEMQTCFPPLIPYHCEHKLKSKQCEAYSLRKRQ